MSGPQSQQLKSNFSRPHNTMVNIGIDIDVERDYLELQSLFPNAKFEVCIRLSEMDNILTKGSVAIIKCTHECECFCKCHRHQPDFIYVKGKSKMGVSVRDAISALVESDYNPDCAHYFLEGFQLTKDSDVQFVPHFGS